MFQVQFKVNNASIAISDIRAEVPRVGAQPGVLRPARTAATETRAQAFEGFEGKLDRKPVYKEPAYIANSAYKRCFF